MDISFARGRSEEELDSTVGRLTQEGFVPYGGGFVLHEYWSLDDARASRRADVHYRVMRRDSLGPELAR